MPKLLPFFLSLYLVSCSSSVIKDNYFIHEGQKYEYRIYAKTNYMNPFGTIRFFELESYYPKKDKYDPDKQDSDKWAQKMIVIMESKAKKYCKSKGQKYKFSTTKVQKSLAYVVFECV